MKPMMIFILLFGFAGNVSGEEIDSEMTKSLGISLLPMDLVVMCESGGNVGFNWNNGRFVFTKFKLDKFILKKNVNACGLNFKNTISKIEDYFVIRKVCIKYKKFGEGDKIGDLSGGICYERYWKTSYGSWMTNIECTRNQIFLPVIIFSPNGLFTRGPTYLSMSLSFEDKTYRDSLTVGWGSCATISP